LARLALLLGTCRIHDPAQVIREEFALPVRSTRHRLHTAMQTLQFMRHISGAATVYSERDVHLLSDVTAHVISGRQDPAQILEELEPLRRSFPAFDCFVIEISSLREHWIERPDGSKFYVNTFCRKDLAAHPKEMEVAIERGLVDPVRPADIRTESMTRSRLLKAMRQIGRLAARPILWISHMRPGVESPEFENVNRVRKHLADALAVNAVRLSHHFFDPTVQLAAVGREQFLAKDGTDLDHLSKRGALELASVYRDFIASC
jgi:hypothetical protein